MLGQAKLPGAKLRLFCGHAFVWGLALFLSFHLLSLGVRSQSQHSIKFENWQGKSGIHFVLNNGTTADKPIVDSVLGGVAVLDFDNDGFLDIFFTNGATLPEMVKKDPSFQNRLYHNNHDGTFTDVTQRAGVAGS